MSGGPDAARLLLEAQLKALAAKMDVKNPMADVKTQVSTLVDGIKAIRGSHATRADNDARVTFMHFAADTNMLDRVALGEMRSTLAEVEAVRALQVELHEQLGHALARLNEARAHIAMANATMAKLIGTVTEQVETSVKRDAERAAAPVLGKTLRLQIHIPGMTVTEQTFDEPIIKVGKLATSHLNLPDENISRMHAVIERVDTPQPTASEPGWYVIDLGSPAGTIVNDRKVNKAKLATGDSILFGGVNVRVLG